jgi:queuine tRNA-ribosyltransferase
MLHASQKFIPVGTSPAGLCLTAANWQEVQVNSIAFHLDSLLVKPGFDLLKKIPDFSQYMGWPGTVLLNASKLVANKERIFTLTSPFDGSKIKLTYFQLIEIIQHIKPNSVLLPPQTLQQFPEMWQSWNAEITPFFAVEDLLKQEISRSHGVYFNVNKASYSDSDLVNIKNWSHLTRYITGSINLDLMQHLGDEGVEWIESDEPAAAAMEGKVFSNKGIINLVDDTTAMQFEPIDAQCTCPTCSQQFTKAYLHHLLLHTPLLCQRFLIQHNVFYANKSMEK